ncbi:hypothetical protein R5R35_007360 [Gryllus longicercus]|uniref:Beta-glucosidase n=1 Tax=Gryllus longicercus TaxID=2509291 RepID=A0AAN9YYN5_9ORTH
MATAKSHLLLVWLLLAATATPAVVGEKGRDDGDGENVKRTFPAGFMFGTATAAYQVEGAWNEDGKGENIWDHMVHEHPEYIRDNATGDIADDSYHKYEEDVRLLAELGSDFYRFSISWARILPKGDLSQINQLGLNYYDNLINELLDKGIEPLVTMYHWDLPQALQELGGWPNPILVDYFEDYARLLIESYGDRVKHWITFNEPLEFTMGYAKEAYMPPSINKPGVGDYLATHTVLLAHARVYHMYDTEYRPTQQGNISITLNTDWVEPASDSPEDIAAQDRMLQFNFGWFAHPIFSEEGDYPQVMRERVAANSEAEGLPRSRLPTFTPEEVAFIRGSSDFLGLNHYTTSIATSGEEGPNPSRDRDRGSVGCQDPTWPTSASSWLKVAPWGFRKLLNWLHKEYNGVTIMVTENGFSDSGELNDAGRENYYKTYINALWEAIMIDGVNVFAYAAWSALDNFEWTRGYAERFGIYHVNYDDPNLTRTPKSSAQLLKSIFTEKMVEKVETPSEYSRSC